MSSFYEHHLAPLVGGGRESFPGRSFLRERKDTTATGEEELLSVSEYTGVTRRRDNVGEGGHLSRAESLEGYRLVRRDDLVVNYMLAWKGALGVSALDGITSPAYAVFEIDQRKVTPRFAHALFRSDLFKAYFRSESSGIVESRLRLYPEAMLSLKIVLPTRSEQDRIAAYLDSETARIDGLIEKKTIFIELLREKRQTLITQAVTKGLDPGVPMKDSGVEWFGQVPSTYTVTRLMHLTDYGKDIMYGIVLPGPDVETGIPIVKGGNVKEDQLTLAKLCRTTPEIEMPFARARLRPNDIVYSIRGSIGDAELVPEELLDANITQDVARVSPGPRVNPRWLLYFLKSKGLFAQLDREATGATIRGINIFSLKRAIVALPSLSEQKDIVRFLDGQCERIDRLSKAAGRSVELLRERRAALITASVTGQIDMRSEQPALEALEPA